MYKVLIVDDEFLARKLLQGYVEKIPELEIAGTAANAFEAFKAIKEQAVDILLLDIHMPDLNGLDFARTCHDIPAIIFTTAYSEYALESYEVSAVDYLLKPIALPRFEEAIQKAISKVQLLRGAANAPSATDDATTPPDADATPSANNTATTTTTPTKGEGKTLANALADQNEGKDFMLVKADYKLYKINYADLLYIEGQHEYVSFHTRDKRITALYALKTLEEMLPADKFIRVHKSYIVAIGLIQEIEQLSITVAGVKIPVGGNYRDALMKKLGAV